MRRFTIGRSRQNDIVIEEPSVSRRHAELRELGGGWYKIVDLGSTHGTQIEKSGVWEELTVAEVTRRHRVRFGSYTRSIDSLLDAALVVKPSRRPRQTLNTLTLREPAPRSGGMAVAAGLFIAVGAVAAAAYYFMPT